MSALHVRPSISIDIYYYFFLWSSHLLAIWDSYCGRPLVYCALEYIWDFVRQINWQYPCIKRMVVQWQWKAGQVHRSPPLYIAATHQPIHPNYPDPVDPATYSLVWALDSREADRERQHRREQWQRGRARERDGRGEEGGGGGRRRPRQNR